MRLFQNLGASAESTRQLQRRLDYQWDRTRGVNFRASMQHLPPAVQTELAYAVYKYGGGKAPLATRCCGMGRGFRQSSSQLTYPTTLPPLARTRDSIDRVPLFASRDAAFKRLLALVMEPFQVQAGDYIVHKVGAAARGCGCRP